MHTSLKKTPGGQPWIILGIVMLCLIIGAAIPLIAGIAGNQPSRLIALPALLLFVMVFLYDYKKSLILILLLRSVGDIVLESAQFGIGNFHMGIGGLINLAVIMIACLLVLEKPALFPGRLARYWVPILLMMGVGLVTSYETAGAIKVYLGMLSYFAIFVIAVYTVRSNDDFNKAIRLVVWSSLIPTLYSIIDVALHMRDSGFRLKSTFAHANILAFYLMLMLVLCLYMLKSRLYRLTPRGRILICCYMPFLLGQMLLTQTRSAWFASFIVFASYAILFERKYLWYLLLLPLVAILIPAVHDRLMDLGEGGEVVRYAQLNSFAWRLVLWKAAINWMEPLRLIYGYGLTAFSHFTPIFFELDKVTNFDAHNVYVQFLFEIGVIGLLGYMWLYFRVTLSIRSLLHFDPISGFLMLAIVLQYLLVSFSDNMYRYLVFNWYFWFIMGGACALSNLQAQTMRLSAGSATWSG